MVAGVGHRRGRPAAPRRRPRAAVPGAAPVGTGGRLLAPGRRRYQLVPERSVVLVEARSTVGPISFGALGLSGVVDVEVADGKIVIGSRPSALVEVPIATLRSGNRLYDAELLRRVDAARYPVVTLDLHQCVALGVGDLYRLEGSATVHGVTRPVTGTVVVHLSDDGVLDVSGDQVFDIRDFGIESPTVLMLRIYPDVTVRLHIEATGDGDQQEVSP